jgi:malate dehydrogenase
LRRIWSLSLLIKQSPLVNQLSLFDVQHTKGVGADLSHIETKCKVKAFVGYEQLHDSLVGADVVVIPGKVKYLIKSLSFCFNKSIINN